jgi:dienelactone hydrolase
MAKLSRRPSGFDRVMRILFSLFGVLFLFGCQTASTSPARVPSNVLKAHAITFKSGDRTQLTGYLYEPAGEGPFNTVLMMHGCAGMLNKDGSMKTRERAWLDILRNEGYAVMLADSFTDRGYGSICRVKNRPISPSKERPHDAYGALQWLQTQPFVRPDSITLMGWSNGAMSMLWAVRSNAPQRPAALKHDFRAAIGFYPGCIRLRREIEDYMAAVPVLLQIGLADDWTKPKPCMALVKEANARGGKQMVFDAYEGAYHAFDNPDSRQRTITTKHSAYSSGQRTVHVGTNPEARAKAITKVKAYLRQAFSK